MHRIIITVGYAYMYPIFDKLKTRTSVDVA